MDPQQIANPVAVDAAPDKQAPLIAAAEAAQSTDPPCSSAVELLSAKLAPPEGGAVHECADAKEDVFESPAATPPGNKTGAPEANRRTSVPTAELGLLQIASGRPALTSSVSTDDLFEADEVPMLLAPPARSTRRRPLQLSISVDNPSVTESQLRRRRLSSRSRVAPLSVPAITSEDRPRIGSRHSYDSELERAHTTGTHICRGIYIGPLRAASNTEWLVEQQVTFVLNMCKAASVRTVDSVRRGVEFLDLPCEDSRNQDIEHLFGAAHRFMDRAIRKNESVLVHCHAGISRSTTIVISYLMSRGEMSLLKAFSKIKSKRPTIQPNSGFLRQLMKYEYSLRGSNSVSIEDCTSTVFWCYDDSDNLPQPVLKLPEE